MLNPAARLPRQGVSCVPTHRQLTFRSRKREEISSDTPAKVSAARSLICCNKKQTRPRRKIRSREIARFTKAKRVIYLFMHGGPSHLETFDPKPELQRLAGQPLPASFGAGCDRRNVAEPFVGDEENLSKIRREWF